VGQLHNHILDGVRQAILLTNRGVLPAVAESPRCSALLQEILRG
jgi:hypothetical protein